MKKNSEEGQGQSSAIRAQRAEALRILILFSDVGEGHVSTARTLAADLRSSVPSAEITLDNGFDVLGRFLCWFMRDFYRWQLLHFPGLYWFGYGLFRRVKLCRWLGALLLWLLGSRAELNLVLGHSPDLVISTDARLNAVLGQLRRAGKLKAPVFATLTDLAGLEFWAHKGVDLHLVMDPTCLGPVERVAGPGAARLVRPLVAPCFFHPLPKATARQSLGLSPDGRLVLVSGGGWGIGDFEGAIRAALGLPDTRVVCLAGRNQQVKSQLEAIFGDESRLTVLGFTPYMNELLAASDAVVHSTGGVTYLEALVRDRPVLAYKPPPGHPQVIASTLAKRGCQQEVECEADLPAALLAAFSRPKAKTAALAVPSAASTILNAAPRVHPLPGWRVWGTRAAVALLLALLLGAWIFSTDEPFPAIARAFDLRSVTSTSSGQACVGLVIQISPDFLPQALADLARHGDRASFAYTAGWSPGALRAVECSGNEALPSLGRGSLAGWVHTRGTLAKEATSLGVSRPGVYLPPRDGFTLGQYVLARMRGALPLGGGLRLDPRLPRRVLAVKQGEVLVLDLSSNSSSSLQFLDGVLTALEAKGLAGVPLPSSSLRESTPGKPRTASLPGSLEARGRC
jgi:processive 1,2-diacylglycerol beta-glucosyltransferase